MIPAPAPSPPPPGARCSAPADARLLGTLGRGPRCGGGGISPGGPSGRGHKGPTGRGTFSPRPRLALSSRRPYVAGVGVGMGPSESEDGGGTAIPTPHPHTHTTASSGRRRPRSGCVRGVPADHSSVDGGCPGGDGVQDIVQEDGGSLPLPALSQPSVAAWKEGAQKVFMTA